ncbi:unnamed protein product [Toxocara canis]|uniref:Expressed conserved protein n=1 Tax=Toxocara canis TaxID=6265 RepID=A0A183UCN0_TOXCA|nr:unnamed protein product [Toxocara canis]
MQRLSSWFEQLPLRRRSSQRRAEAQRPQKQSKSAAPRLRYSFSAAVQNHQPRDHSVDVISLTVPASWNRQETVTNACNNAALPTCGSLSQSFSSGYSSGRMKIRTNPWISRDRPSLRGNLLPPKPPNELLYASVDRCSSLRVKSLDESTCSSGYGSQDSSPESSVHSPDWQPSITVGKRGRLEDKAVECRSIDVDEALGLDIDENDDEDDNSSQYKPIGDCIQDDEHVYHELEAFNRMSVLLDERACSSDSEFASSSFSLQRSPRLSPIYAQPYAAYPLQRSNREISYVDQEETEFPNVAASFTYIPCADYRPSPQFHAPPPPPVRSGFDQVEMDFLAELDAQIAELQVKSVAVRQLVDEARERRDARARTNQLCMQQLAELRQLKWVMRDHFELVL